jgi:hypothetical protein
LTKISITDNINREEKTMIKKLDIPTKVKFQEFVKKMAVVHFNDTKFNDLDLLEKHNKARIMHRYTEIPNTHVENFDVKISVEPLGDQDSIPDEIKRIMKIDHGIMYHIHVEISEEKKIIDYFELMEFVSDEQDVKYDFESLYAIYRNSDTREESDFED